MSKFHSLLFAASLTVLAAPVWAQSVGSLSDGSLAMGQEVETPQAPAPGNSDDVTVEQVGDWSLQCAASGPEPRPCRLYQLLNDANDNPIAEITIFKLETPNGPAIAGGTIMVPLETLLPAQVTVAVDGEKAKRYPYAFCNVVGCVSRIGLSADDIEAFKAGGVANIGIVPAAAPNQMVSIDLSLNGFTKAYESANPVNE